MITNFSKTMKSEKLRSVVFQLFLLFALLISVSNSSKALAPARIYQIKGLVADSVSGKGLPYATISVQSGQKGVIKRLASDAAGNFSFTLDTTGKYDVIFQSIGYVTSKKDITLNGQNSKIDLGTIKINPGVEKIGEVSVVAQKPLVRTEVDKVIYSTEVDPEAKTSTALEMLRKVPLVTVDGEDNIQLKGTSNFKILLNGKSSSMLSQNAKDVLRSLPASTIKDIEVITNPSSKYEAEGTGGIINIITTKKQIDGFMGRVSAGVDSRGGFNTGLYATSKIKKFGFSINYNYNEFRQPKNESFTERENFLSTTSRFTETEGFSKYKGSANMAMGEASYEIDSLNLISLSFWGYAGSYSGNGNTLTQDFDISNMLSRKFNNRIMNDIGYGSISGNIDYQRTFKKPDKTFTISYKLDRSPRNSDNENEIEGVLNYESYRQRSTNDASGTEHTFQLDYYDPLTKMHQVETGVKYILRQNVSNSDVLRYDYTTNQWTRDASKINDLDYDQHIFGLYAGYVMKLKKFSVKTGLRVEGTINDGIFKSIKDTTFTNKMFNVIPYVTLSQNLDKGQNLKLSYTQRLSRPGIWYLNPFINDIDPLNISYGNPNLEAEVSHTFDFSYGKFTPKYNFNLSLNSAFTNNTIEQISTMQANGVKVTTYENIGKNQRYGGYLYGMVRIKQKLTINTNIGATYTILESNDGRGLKNEGFNYNGSLNCRYTAWKNGTVSASGGVFSPRIMLQGQSSTYYYNNLSISQEMLKKKLTASLSVSNPFSNRMKYEMTYDDPTFHQEMVNYNYNRQLRFNISYRFGQMKGEIKKAKRGIKNEDVKSGGDSSTGSGTGGTGN
ncbi:MAG: TonB-dependent receptor [Prolixibacteraceae bacterium]|nr:TonB-dependent receptor [Prolixibacteraceae bacterium]